jgi:hypothetical protein
MQELIHRFNEWQTQLSWSESFALFILGAIIGFVGSDLIASLVRTLRGGRNHE